MGAARRPGQAGRAAVAVALLLLLATLAAYAPVFQNDFVEYDDRTYILKPPQVRGGFGAGSLVWAFTSFHGANWFPLTRISWMLDAELFGLEPRGFHATSLALHAASALLLFAAFRRLTGDLWPSAFVAAAFALHPLHVESVAWAAARKDVLSGLFFMLALLAHERVARSERRGRWVALLTVALALGLMSKPMLVTLPFVLLLLDRWPLGRWKPGDPPAIWVPLLREKGLLFALVGITSLVTFVAQERGGVMAETQVLPLGLRLANAAVAYGEYVARTLWPAQLGVLYPLGRTLGLVQVLVSAAGLVIVSLLALRSLAARPWLGVGWLWFVGMLVPVIGLVQVGSQASADRYTYLPLIGLSVAVAWGVPGALGRAPEGLRPVARRLVGLLAGLACLLMLGATWRQVGFWKDSLTLFERTVAVTERNAYMLYALALEYEKRGDLDHAEANLEASVQADPGEARALRALARLRLATKRPEAAVAPLLRLVELEPGAADAHRSLGRALHLSGDYAGARAHYREALALAPGDPVARAYRKELRRDAPP